LDAGHPSAQAAPPGGDALSGEVLRTVVTLAEQLHPHQRGRLHAELSGDLDRDFGLDSLGRVEAIHRLEALFGVALPDGLFAEASTPADLVEALRRTGHGARPSRGAVEPPAAGADARAAPPTLNTLPQVLAWHAAEQGDRSHIRLSNGEAEEPPITYGMLEERAQRLAGALVAQGVASGDRIALMLPTDADFFSAFMGVVLAGAVPAPVYPPWRMLRIEEHLRRQARILDKAGARGVIAFDEALPFARLLRDHAPSLQFVDTAAGLEAHAGPAPSLAPRPSDLALLQFTSGSTADPKGVMLSHANILANVRALARAIGATPADVYVSWLPLYHDMGLIAAWLACLDQAVPLVAMSPLSFMARPERWLWTIHRNRATITAAPNFAFELCLALPEAELQGLDLSSLRVAGCGSEPVSRRTLEDFARKFAPYGFRAESLTPVYGLAESAAALTAAPPGRRPRVDFVDRRTLAGRGQARPIAADSPEAQAFVSCGAALIGHEVRILDPLGGEAVERQEGRLQFRGPSATCGYFNDPQKTAELFADGWLESGDLAYVADGEVFVTGRTKDVVKRAGRNIHPEDVETAIAALPNVAPRGAVLISTRDPERGMERLVLIVETASEDEAEREALYHHAQERAADHLETAVDEIVLVPPDTVPRTESGKVRRGALRELYREGLGTGEPVSPRRQAIRLRLTAGLGGLRRSGRLAGEWLYARYWWAVIGAIGLVLWPLVVFLPSLRARWVLTRRASRLGLKLLGHRLTVANAGPPLPAQGVVYVANHSSYLDSVVLSAILPGEPAFAGFKELADDPVEGPFLRGLGALFVERFEPRGAVAAAEQALQALEHGRPLAMFPESTIMRAPGLLEFRMGAFAAAAPA
jgi:1-acyl-sn-glycerol-3-phosphate acyltransferase